MPGPAALSVQRDTWVEEVGGWRGRAQAALGTRRLSLSSAGDA